MTVNRLITLVTVGLVLCLGVVGCATVGSTALHVAGLQSISTANAQIEAVKSADAAKVAALQGQIDTLSTTIHAAEVAKTQEAANHVFLAEMTFNLDPSPTGFGLLMHTENVSAALTLPPPDATTIATGIDKMKAILADKDKQVAAMAAEVSAAKAKADQLNATVSTAQSQIAAVKGQIEVVKQTDTAQIAAIQKVKDAAVSDALTKQAALLDDKAANDLLKKKLCIGAAGIAAIAFLAAIFSPLLKRQCVETGMLFAGLAVAVPYVEGWMVGAALGVGILYVAISTLLEHKAVVAKVPVVNATPIVASPPAAAPVPVAITSPTPAPVVTATPVSVAAAVVTPISTTPSTTATHS